MNDYPDIFIVSRVRPILFSGPMVRAILDGRKTVTRRPAKGVRPPYDVGDLLWVRETWGVIVPDDHDEQGHARGGAWLRGTLPNGLDPRWVVHRATYGDADPDAFWRPSIHMPRWASRLTLEVTAVDRGRLSWVTDAEAVREGFADRAAFLATWDAIYGKRGTVREVWRVAFTVRDSSQA